MLDCRAVNIGCRTETDDADTGPADLKRQVLHEGLDGTKSGSDRRRAFDVPARWAARQEEDDA